MLQLWTQWEGLTKNNVVSPQNKRKTGNSEGPYFIEDDSYACLCGFHPSSNQLY